MELKRRVWHLVETAEGDDPASYAFDVIIIVLIIASVLLVVLDSVPGMLSGYGRWTAGFETFAVVVFSAEYALRVWSSPASPRYSGRGGRLRFALTPLALVDLVAIAPFYLPWLLPRSLLVLRVLRLLRLLRLFKFGRYSDAPEHLARALRSRRAELLAALFVLGLLLISMSGLLYLVEQPVQPDLYSSIPLTMWWMLLALTGNGQVAPVTLVGRLIASGVAILGVGLVALPAGLLASAFTEELTEQRAEERERRMREEFGAPAQTAAQSPSETEEVLPVAPARTSPAPPERESLVRDHLANERTFLAWMRTALALLGFGFLIARLRFEATAGLAGDGAAGRTALGIGFAAAGILTSVLATWHYFTVLRAVDRGGFKPLSAGAVVTAAALCLLAAGVILNLLGALPPF